MKTKILFGILSFILIVLYSCNPPSLTDREDWLGSDEFEAADYFDDGNQTEFFSCDEGEGEIVGDVFVLDWGQVGLPNFDCYEIETTICINKFAVEQRYFKGGFPGYNDLDQYFGIRFETNLQINITGVYKFYLNSDDGAILYIDDLNPMNNDGQHSPQMIEKEYFLEEGIHTLRMDYYQGPKWFIALELFWIPPGETEMEYVPSGAFISNP